ncbi:MAG: thioredoxin [Terrimicrobiaceae bacterium]
MKGNTLTTLIVLVIGGAIAWTAWKEFRPAPEPVADASGGKLVLMDFYADWCPPCKTMKPVVREFANEFRGQITVLEIDVDESPGLARQYNVRSIPTFVVTRDGKEVNRRSGAMPKEGLIQMAGL